MPVSRREFLSQLAMAAGATALGCRDTGDPDPGPTDGSIDNIVVVTMENRSFDHFLGWAGRVRIVYNAYLRVELLL